MTAKDLALLLLQAHGGLEVEINGDPIQSISIFGGRLNIDSDTIALDEADLIFFDARDVP